MAIGHRSKHEPPKVPNFWKNMIFSIFTFISEILSNLVMRIRSQLSPARRQVEGGTSHVLEYNQNGMSDNDHEEVTRNQNKEPTNVPTSGNHFNTIISRRGTSKNSQFVYKENKNF